MWGVIMLSAFVMKWFFCSLTTFLMRWFYTISKFIAVLDKLVPVSLVLDEALVARLKRCN
ncbi:MAG: hypothetical protein ACJATV_000823 [Granulosicoccus sp.]|jgi:hypothetical protein